MNIKSVFSLLLCFLLLCSVFSGCREKSEGSKNPFESESTENLFENESESTENLFENESEEEEPILYSAKSSLIATVGGIADNTSSKISSADLAATLNIVDTFVDIMKTYSFYESLAELPEIKQFGYTAEELRGMTSISRRADMSLFIDIKVIDQNPKTAVILANTIAENAPSYIGTWPPNAQAVWADKCISATKIN